MCIIRTVIFFSLDSILIVFMYCLGGINGKAFVLSSFINITLQSILNIYKYLLLAAKNIQVSIAKNVNIITYETSTKNISFIAGFDRTPNKTAMIPKHNGKRKAYEKSYVFGLNIYYIRDEFIQFIFIAIQ